MSAKTKPAKKITNQKQVKAAPALASKAPKGAAAKESKKPAMQVPTMDMGLNPAVAGKTEDGAAPAAAKSYRHHPDMENFFRFIFDNDLRPEALKIIDEVMEVRRLRRLGKKGEVIKGNGAVPTMDAKFQS